MIAEVYPILKLPRKCTYFDYALPNGLNLAVGDLVKVPFKGRETLGIVRGLKATSEAKKLISITAGVQSRYLNEVDIQRYEHIASYLVQSVSSLLHTALPASYFSGQAPLVHASKTPSIGASDVPVLEECLSKISQEDVTVIAGDRDFGFALAYALRRKQPGQMLVLLPREREAELLAKYVKLGDTTSLLHGKTKPKDRVLIAEAWRTGKINTLIGTRAASLLPAHSLKTVLVLDAGSDEHINERRNPRFDAREVAKLLAADQKAKLVLVDALPRLEELVANQLHQTTKQPDVGSLINLGSSDEITNEVMLSDSVIAGLETALHSHKKVLIYLNRKGVAKRLQCGKCGHIPLCGNCGHVPIVRHDDLVCPNCHIEMWIPAACPACGKPRLALRGVGGAKIATTLKQLFPNASLGRLEKGAVENPDADIIIATEYLFSSYLEPFASKRYGLIVDLAGDISLHAGDFRGAEDTARKLHRLLNLAHRHGAQALIQTWLPDVLRPMLDLPAFIASELSIRQKYSLPPYSNRITLENITFESLPPELVEHAVERGSIVEINHPSPIKLLNFLKSLPDSVKLHYDGPYAQSHDSAPQSK